MSKKLKVSKRSQFPPFMALDIMRQSSELAARGADIVHLEIGQPSTAAPQKVNEAMTAALRETSSHGYSIAFGQLPLRQRISRVYDEWYGARLQAENISVTVGSSTAFALAFLAAFDKGDRIAIPNPGYPAYRNLMMAMGLEPVLVSAGEKQGWKPVLSEIEKWERLPDGLMIASPANPTGAVLSDSELADICRWCDSKGVRLISDEIYHGLAYGQRCDTALNYTKNAIIINSLSKYFSMTGWRIGWMVMPDDLLTPVEKLAQNLFISAPTPNQMAAVAAFDCSVELDRHVLRYAQNRDILLQGLPVSLTEGAAPCQGAFYLFANIRQYSDNSTDFAARLLAEQGVATTPGVDFDPIDGHRYLRLSFAGSTADMHEAVLRINSFTASLKTNAA